ncbi:uncharacterized protein BDR25DRAFT_80726 [Lindgomyces ingoldianus]|uniref:Uncharacterized protein n=1 Tax=Lindgomyces ingoldianus TaxID=673940 RepID=A0ACB6QFT7_9PLEO|nr:uncharacterized protein BDR25DRAFT_80726 [Lindgomyces ingoldianus]KAF2465884.1 hypothetical protein BDR25DRAFT_80726 [Lindgomyces ingoldianus]
MAMHLASMVHGSGREREAPVHHRHLHQHSNFYPHPQQPLQRVYEVPTSVAASPYSHLQTTEYQFQRHPQSPPSPPVEEQKPSLPSISSLLVIAGDAEKAASETAGQSPKSQQNQFQQQQQSSPQIKQEPQRAAQQVHQAESRPDQAAHAFGPAIVSNPRMTLPPTPPMQPDSVVDGNQSPSAASSHSAVSAPYFLGQSLNNMEPHQQRQNVPSAPPGKRHSLPSQPSMSPYNASAYSHSPYAASPGAASTGSFYSPETHAFNSVGMYGQRPLPSNFQPQTMPLPVPTGTANGSNPWQHHHYISASSQAAFPQSQDRYICSTCNKAFSRPSSLRIHSHSHTGEKPYKCPQPGCGKAFSVRSNMKRHERGCHASASTSITTAS